MESNAMERKYAEMQMALEHVTDMLRELRPNKRWYLDYFRETETSIADFTAWDRERFRMYPGEEYITVRNEDQHLLYVLHVSANSVLCCMAELFELLTEKF